MHMIDTAQKQKQVEKAIKMKIRILELIAAILMITEIVLLVVDILWQNR